MGDDKAVALRALLEMTDALLEVARVAQAEGDDAPIDAVRRLRAERDAAVAEAGAAAMREAITNVIYEINAQRDDVGAATVLIDSVAETWVRMLRAALEDRRG